MDRHPKMHLGAGGASAVLMFSVLCLTIFALISFTTAHAESAAVDKLVESALAYYAADAEAERLVAEGQTDFAVPVDARRELAVVLDEAGKVREWRLRDTDEWNPDLHLPVWEGE